MPDARPVDRLRAAAIYAAAWTPLVLVYVVAIAAQEPMPVWAALASALRSVGFAAVLGVAVVALARRVPWPERLSWRFVLVHGLSGVAYGLAWVACILLLLRVAIGDWSMVAARAHDWWAWQTFFGVLLYWIVAGVTWTREAAARARVRERALAEADAARVRAELQALRAQLDPHFLFNTLHGAAVLTRHDPPAAADALERLAGLLRYVLDAGRGVREDVALAEELAFVDAYLALEGLRLGDRLRVVREIEAAALTTRVPSLVLQPLVENALKYGISPRPAGGTLSLRACVQSGALVLEVADDGPGGDPDAPARGSGLGLATLRQRLTARFGTAATLEIRAAPAAGFHVVLQMPA